MLPFLTRDIAGIGGVIKQRDEDFFVQEIPLYEASGEGEHVYCEIQKVGLTTFDAIDRIARALRIPSREIGYAGLKDARAVTRQVFSLRGTTEAAVMGLKLPQITVQWAARHGNKLRLGHLAGNRFAIKIREVSVAEVIRVRPALELLSRRGMPNYFGEQRFGRRGDNDLLGAAFVRGDDAEVMRLLLGNPIRGIDDGQTFQARSAFDAGDLGAAMKHWPRRCGMERRLLHRLVKTGRAGAAARAVDQRFRRLWVSALQSRVFNGVVARRIDSLDRLLDGDLAWKHDNGACFAVPEAAIEQPRCDAFEISPSGPLVGYRMTLPTGEPLRIEQEEFATIKLAPSDFRSDDGEKAKGARRPLRVQPKDIELMAGGDEHGPYITVAFTLPAGSFATVLLRELMKNDVEGEAHSKPAKSTSSDSDEAIEGND